MAVSPELARRLARDLRSRRGPRPRDEPRGSLKFPTATPGPSMLAALEFFGQTLDWHDLGVIGLLVLLEGALSIDNALVLGLLAKRLPKEQQRKALTYGLIGAFVFRFIAVFMASLLLKWRVVKLLGGGYLVYIAIKHLFFEAHEDDGDVAFTAAGEPTL